MRSINEATVSWTGGRPRRWGEVLWRAKTRSGLRAGVFLIGSGCASILIDQSAEDSVTSDRGVDGDRGGGVVGWWVLSQALVRPVGIEVAHVPVKDTTRVSLVVDQHPVGALGAHAADESFRVAVRPGRVRRVLTTSMTLVVYSRFMRPVRFRGGRSGWCGFGRVGGRSIMRVAGLG